ELARGLARAAADVDDGQAGDRRQRGDRGDVGAFAEMLALGQCSCEALGGLRRNAFPPPLRATEFTQVLFATLFMELRGGLERRRRLVAKAEGREIECPVYW